MRYLYGDATGFSEQYDFLATLRGFVECAGRVLRLHHEAFHLEAELGERLDRRAEVLRQVQEYCDTVEALLQTTLEDYTGVPAIEAIARQQLDMLSASLERAVSTSQAESQRDQAETEAEARARRNEIQGAIGRFLMGYTLPVERSSFAMRLVGEVTALTSTVEYRGGLSAAFELDPSRTTTWATPQRVSAFVQGMNVQLGLKKKFLSRELAPDVVLLDDFVVSGITLTDESCEVRFRRKVDHPADSVIIGMRRDEGQLMAQITRTEGEQVGTNDAVPADHGKLSELWNVISQRAAVALPHKLRIQWLHLDGGNVLEDGLVFGFVDRLVEEFSPIVSAIEKHSPNPEELSLKIERGDGRREEIYVRKEELAKHLSGLPDRLLERFAALDIFPPASFPISVDDE